VGETFAALRHEVRVIGHKELLDWLKSEREAGRLKNADLQRLLNLPSSRVAEIFSGGRQIQLDEARLIVDHYQLESSVAAINAETLGPILAAVLPLAPPEPRAERFLPILAEAVVYGLGLLADQPSSSPHAEAVRVAARAAASRFRDLSLQ
jgi:hypothetical protein